MDVIEVIERGDVDALSELRTSVEGFHVCAKIWCEKRELTVPAALFLLNTMAALVQKYGGMLEWSAVRDVYCLCVEFVAGSRPGVLVRAVGKLFGVITLHFWGVEEARDTFKALDFSANHELVVKNVLWLYEETINVFREFRIESDPVHSSFSNRCVCDCFEAAEQVVQSKEFDKETLDAALSVMKSCLMYGHRNDDGFIVQLASMRQELVVSNVEVVCVIYREQCLSSALECLFYYAATAHQSFLDLTEEVAIMQLLGSTLSGVVRSRTGFEELPNIFMFSRTLEMWIRKVNIVVLKDLSFAQDLFSGAAEWTLELLHDTGLFRMNPVLYLNMMQFWKVVVDLIQNYAMPYKVDVLELIQNIFKQYLEFLVCLTGQQEECYTVFGGKTWFLPLGYLIGANRESLTDHLLTFFQGKTTETCLSLFIRIVGLLLTSTGASVIECGDIEKSYDILIPCFLRLLETEDKGPLFEKSVADVLNMCRHESKLQPFTETFFNRALKVLVAMSHESDVAQKIIKAIESLEMSEEMVKKLISLYESRAYRTYGKRTRYEFFGLLLRSSYQLGLFDEFIRSFADDDLMELTIDLTGLFAGAQNVTTYSAVATWFIDSHAKCFCTELTTDLANQALKMWYYLTWEEARRKRIVFHEFSPTGQYIFNVSAQFMSSVFSAFSGSSQEARPKLVRRISRVMENLLDNRYVCYGAYSIYGDPTLAHFITLYGKFLAAVNLEEIMQYKDSASALWRSILALSRRHLRTCDGETVDVVMNAVAFGISCGDAAITKLSYEIISVVCRCVIANRASAFASRYTRHLRHCATSLWHSLLNGALIDITMYGSILRDLVIIDPTTIAATKSTAKQQFPGSVAMIDEAFSELDSNLDAMLAPGKDGQFNIQLQRINECVRHLSCPSVNYL